MGRPTLIIISGPSATGKTTLAHEIARLVPCPAICRDEIKEGMVHAHGGDFAAGWGDELTRRTFPLFFEVLEVLLRAEVTVVADAAFQHEVWTRALEPLLPLASVVAVQCYASNAAERHLTRGERQAHVSTPLGAEYYGSFRRLDLKPSIDVDTTDGYVPSLDEIVGFVHKAFTR